MMGLLRDVVDFTSIVKILCYWYINKVILLSCGLEHIGIRSLANFALKLFKVVATQVCLLL